MRNVIIMVMKTLLSISLLLFSIVAFSVTRYQRPSDTEIKQKLSPMQYHVTQEKGTEPAYHNEYWDNKESGIYVDIVSGEPLFSSLDKYDSKTGWPSFTKPLETNNIMLQPDEGWFFTRTEVISKQGRSHLGHVFNDGPPPTYKRYCINSASLLFIPAHQLEVKGYRQYLPLFNNSVTRK